MNNILQICFWLLLLLSVYSYFIYPMILHLLPARNVHRSPEATQEYPSVSVIIAAHNEARGIRAKIENMLDLDPYEGRLEMIVASDASNDGTDEIVAEYAEKCVSLVRNPEHDGKEAAQALAIKAAKGDILVFTDVATSMRGDVLDRIVTHFRNTDVGAISSVDRFVDRQGELAGEGAYVRYEMWLRRQETRVASLVGLSGSFFAARAEVCRLDWKTSVPSDLLTAINCVKSGKVAVSAEDVVGYYSDIADSSKEYSRKVRTVLRGMWALAETPEILNPFRYRFFAFQVWSHKMLRWLVPWSLLLLLPVNFAIAGTAPVYAAVLLAQLVFYGSALLGRLYAPLQRLSVVRMPLYFLVANLAVFQASIDFLRGRKVVTWKPSTR